MKTLKTLALIFLSNICFGQILEIKEMPEYDKQSMDSLNKYRVSLGLKELKIDTAMVSAAKHHAYYLAYTYTENASHFETIDVPNFKEKLEADDRVGHRTNEILFSNLYGISRDTTKGTVQSFNDKILKEGYKNPGNYYLAIYKDSPSHHKIMIKSDADLIGSYTLLLRIKYDYKGKKIQALVIINVTEIRPSVYTIGYGSY